MFNFLKNKETLLKDKLEKLQAEKNNNLEHLKAINSIAVITSQEIYNNFKIKDIIENTLNVKDVKVYSLRKFNKEDTPSLTHFSEKDFNKKSKILDPNFDAFINQKFDLLLGVFQENNLFLELPVALSKSSCKVGFSKVNSELFDIEISSNIKNFNQFLSELKKYLIIMRKLKSA